jgi:autotransporter-associated beta strand protein
LWWLATSSANAVLAVAVGSFFFSFSSPALGPSCDSPGITGAIAADNYPTTAFDFSTPGLTAASLGAVGVVDYTGTLTPNGTTYRLGGGGATLNFNRANILTGANNVVIGAISAAIQANSTSLQGGGGTLVLNTANDYSGFTTFNLGQTVQIGHDNAFGTSTLIFNGGTLNGDAYNRNQAFTAGRQIANAAKFAGDAVFNSTFNGQPTDLTFSGAVGLSNDPVGGSLRTITVNSATYAQNNGSIVTFSGVISDGDSAYNSLNKGGAGTLRLTGTNTYSGGSDLGAGTTQAGAVQALGNSGTVTLTTSGATLQTLTAGFAGQNGKLTVAALNNAAGGIIKIGG